MHAPSAPILALMIGKALPSNERALDCSLARAHLREALHTRAPLNAARLVIAFACSRFAARAFAMEEMRKSKILMMALDSNMGVEARVAAVAPTVRNGIDAYNNGSVTEGNGTFQ